MIYSPCNSLSDQANAVNLGNKDEMDTTVMILKSAEQDLASAGEELCSILNVGRTESSWVWNDFQDKRRKFRSNDRKKDLLRKHQNRLPHLLEKSLERFRLKNRELSREILFLRRKLKKYEVGQTSAKSPTKSGRKQDLKHEELSSKPSTSLLYDTWQKFDRNKTSRRNERKYPYNCTLCGKLLENKHIAYHHREMHSGRQAGCRYCGKVYSRNDNRLRHERTCSARDQAKLGVPVMSLITSR